MQNSLVSSHPYIVKINVVIYLQRRVRDAGAATVFVVQKEFGGVVETGAHE